MVQKSNDQSPDDGPGRKIETKVSPFQKTALDDILVKGEEVIVQGKIHWAIYWKSFAVMIIALLVGLFIVTELGVLLLVTGVAMLAYAWIKQEILLLVLTNKRLLVRYGILQVDVVDLRFSKVESIELERMIPGYLLGYANVVMMGTGNRWMVVPFVANAVEFRRAYNDLTLPEEGPAAQDVKEAKDHTYSGVPGGEAG